MAHQFPYSNTCFITSSTFLLNSTTNHSTFFHTCPSRNLKTKCYMNDNHTTKITQNITKPTKASEVLVEALEREGVTHAFAYPGGASLSIHQALSRSKAIKTILPRNEQGGIIAAEGYARASGKPGVCLTSSGPGATNLVTGLADAKGDSVPLVAITGQVPQHLVGTDTYQEVDLISITKSVTKQCFCIDNPSNIPRIIKEAFYVAQTGRPGPVLIDIHQNVQEDIIIPDWRVYDNVVNNSPTQITKDGKTLKRITEMIIEAKKPVLYIGGGCINTSEELKTFVELTCIPVTSTFMGLGIYPSDEKNDLWLGMIGMYGSICANYAVNNSDLLLAFGVRFDDRATGEIDAFATRAKIVHVDVDSRELGKIKQPHVAVHSDVKVVLQTINELLIQNRGRSNKRFTWRNELKEVKQKHPLTSKRMQAKNDKIEAQYVIEVLEEVTQGNAIITTGVGQHQMFVAQFYHFKSPRQWISSGGMGTMGYGLPAAIGAALAEPGRLVVDVDGDGSFMMNVQELATVRAENIPVKMMVLDNQCLGMVVQPDDNQESYTYLGNRKNGLDHLGPDMVKFAGACGISGHRVWRRSEVREAIKKMVEFPGPYLLHVVTPFQEGGLPIMFGKY